MINVSVCEYNACTVAQKTTNKSPFFKKLFLSRELTFKSTPAIVLLGIDVETIFHLDHRGLLCLIVPMMNITDQHWSLCDYLPISQSESSGTKLIINGGINNTAMQQTKKKTKKQQQLLCMKNKDTEFVFSLKHPLQCVLFRTPCNQQQELWTKLTELAVFTRLGLWGGLRDCG